MRVRLTLGITTVLIILLSCSLSAQNSKPKRVMTAAERNYWGAAISYLDTAHKQSTKVAQTMAGASNGSSTLTEIKDAIVEARRVESAGYEGDYQHHINGSVPSSFAGIAGKIDETHRLFQAAMTEFLEYWKDQNTAHIESGQLTFKRCALVMSSTISQAKAKMSELKAQ